MKAAVLFAGIGGWEIAAHELGIEIAWACEWDEWKAERYRERFPSVALYGDVEQIDGREMLKRHGSIDLLLGSPPCTDISAANHQGRGVDGDESRLYFEAVRLAQQIRPLGCCFENSDRLRVRGADRVMSAMEGAGYACWPLVVAAGHAGAPHIRRRSWLVAADAERIGLRDQPGRSRGESRKGPAFAQDDADTYGDGQSRLSVDAEVGRGAGADGASEPGHDDGRKSADAGLRQQRRRGQMGGRKRGQSQAQKAGPLRQSDAPNTIATGQPLGQRGQPRQEHPAGMWDHSGDSLARHLRMADGVPAGVARKWRSAYGDAVVVPVVKAILSGTISILTSEAA